MKADPWKLPFCRIGWLAGQSFLDSPSQVQTAVAGEATHPGPLWKVRALPSLLMYFVIDILNKCGPDSSLAKNSVILNSGSLERDWVGFHFSSFL